MESMCHKSGRHLSLRSRRPGRECVGPGMQADKHLFTMLQSVTRGNSYCEIRFLSESWVPEKLLAWVLPLGMAAYAVPSRPEPPADVRERIIRDVGWETGPVPCGLVRCRVGTTVAAVEARSTSLAYLDGAHLLHGLLWNLHCSELCAQGAGGDIRQQSLFRAVCGSCG